jgi:hypothetical protein
MRGTYLLGPDQIQKDLSEHGFLIILKVFVRSVLALSPDRCLHTHADTRAHDVER